MPSEETPKTDEIIPTEETPTEKTTKEEDAPAALTAEALALPEGFEVNQPRMDEFLGVMNNADMKPEERAQALINLYADTMKEASEKGSQLWNETQDTWAKECEALPEIGGGKLPETLGGISKLLTEYSGGGEEEKQLRDVFEITGAGNNPHMVKFLDRMAKALVKEGSPASGGPAATSKSDAELLYGGGRG